MTVESSRVNSRSYSTRQGEQRASTRLARFALDDLHEAQGFRGESATLRGLLRGARIGHRDVELTMKRRQS